MPIVLMILGMSVVTYIPRALPAFLLDKISISPKIEGILYAIPYAALGVLIFPGILSVDQSNPIVGLAGGGIAIVLSYFKLNITYVIIGAVLGVIVMKMFLL